VRNALCPCSQPTALLVYVLNQFVGCEACLECLVSTVSKTLLQGVVVGKPLFCSSAWLDTKKGDKCVSGLLYLKRFELVPHCYVDYILIQIVMPGASLKVLRGMGDSKRRNGSAGVRTQQVLFML
jgi:hypothetical protein